MTQNTETADKAKRQKLSAERIADEAMTLIDEVGLDNFSFRSLAGRLGCQAMSIYHYYPSKAHLYEALVDICIAEVGTPPGDLSPWQRMRDVALSIRRVALTHPGFFLYFSIFRLNNISGLTFLNEILKILEETGLDTRTRARQFRVLSFYVMGAGVDESLGFTHGPSAVEPVPLAEAERDFPAIMSVGRYFGDDYHQEMFEYGLDILLDRFRAEAEAHTAAARA